MTLSSIHSITENNSHSVPTSSYSPHLSFHPVDHHYPEFCLFYHFLANMHFKHGFFFFVLNYCIYGTLWCIVLWLTFIILHYVRFIHTQMNTCYSFLFLYNKPWGMYQFISSVCWTFGLFPGFCSCKLFYYKHSSLCLLINTRKLFSRACTQEEGELLNFDQESANFSCKELECKSSRFHGPCSVYGTLQSCHFGVKTAKAAPKWMAVTALQ